MSIKYLVRICFSVLLLSVILISSACSGANDVFTQIDDRNLVSKSGTEYTYLASEGTLCYFGDLAFEGRVRGEHTPIQFWDPYDKYGLYSLEYDDAKDILIRKFPTSEWFGIYRKKSLPPFDYSEENFTRLELVMGANYWDNDIVHITCGDGITDKSEIAKFLADVKLQESPREAGLYDMITNSDGMLENCYLCAVIYGFFEEEPNLAVTMEIYSYNDIAYSVNISGKEYVLPEEWIERLQGK